MVAIYLQSGVVNLLYQPVIKICILMKHMHWNATVVPSDTDY